MLDLFLSRNDKGQAKCEEALDLSLYKDKTISFDLTCRGVTRVKLSMERPWAFLN